MDSVPPRGRPARSNLTTILLLVSSVNVVAALVAVVPGHVPVQPSTYDAWLAVSVPLAPFALSMGKPGAGHCADDVGLRVRVCVLVTVERGVRVGVCVLVAVVDGVTGGVPDSDGVGVAVAVSEPDGVSDGTALGDSDELGDAVLEDVGTVVTDDDGRGDGHGRQLRAGGSRRRPDQ